MSEPINIQYIYWNEAIEDYVEYSEPVVNDADLTFITRTTDPVAFDDIPF